MQAPISLTGLLPDLIKQISDSHNDIANAYDSLHNFIDRKVFYEGLNGV